MTTGYRRVKKILQKKKDDLQGDNIFYRLVAKNRLVMFFMQPDILN